jgi:glucokinase
MSQIQSGGMHERLRRNTLKLAGWTGAWVVTLAIATFGPAFLWESTGLTSGALLINVAAGVGMIVANKDHLMVLDEMQRKIQLEAMALALGVALVFGLAYSTADVAELIPFDAEIGHVVFAVCAAYAFGLFLGHRRYQ